MTTKAKRAEDKSALLVSVARDIIRETGDFDLPMRQLAARAQVSLRTPYELFGSKTGVIRAILKLDQAIFRELAKELTSADWLDNILDRVSLGVRFYAENQPFYRALFRATQAYSGGDETEPARENLSAFRTLTRRAQLSGLIREEIDTSILGETLTDLFAANFRTWASSSFDISLVDAKIGFGFAMVLASAAAEPHASRMRERAMRYQLAVQSFVDPTTGAAATASENTAA
ncbi:TetR/AcrR family transcriptional regulator [Phenylobacterium sp.]|uniref:TetR/AcrR family transcriptional regulator n=1 Tax=Phenylobacterium sp. TaxID=1871053 RepID=UPI0035B4AD91